MQLVAFDTRNPAGPIAQCGPRAAAYHFHSWTDSFAPLGITVNRCFQRVESALHAFRLFKYVDAYETATMFMVLRAYSCGLGARLDLVYDPGRYWACRRRNEG
jgi:hypothetical protein